MTAACAIELPDVPFLDQLARAVQRQHRRTPMPVAIEVREDELYDVLGLGMTVVNDFLPHVGGSLVYEGIEIRTRATGVPRGKYIPIYTCQHCSGGGCLRCGHTGEHRGSP